MTSVTVRVPAKVNLQLSVGPLRSDGYHEVVTVLQAVSLVDEVVATPADDVSVTVEGESAPAVPTDGTNLAARAAAALAERAGLAEGVHLHLRKAIPVAGGMAGGSADAAGALLACATLWDTGLDRDDLLDVARGLGVDVPFALLGGTAVGTNRGEQLTPALARGRFSWVFALADRGLPTPAVYAEIDRLRRGHTVRPPAVSQPLMAALRAGDAPALGRALVNDLQRAAVSLRPPLRMVLEVGAEYGALGGVVSGSGPTCAFLARDPEHALDLAVALSAAGVCRTVRRAYGPVPGARLAGPEGR